MAEKEGGPKDRGNEETVVPELPIRIPLKKPIDTGDGEVTEFVIKREPLGADWAGLKINDLTMLDFMQIGSRITGLPLPIIKKADTRATFRLAEVISSFL